MTPWEEILACQKLLGYEDGSLLQNVTRYMAYCRNEIATLTAGGRRVADYAEALRVKLSEKDQMEAASAALNDAFKGSPRSTRDCAVEKQFHDNLAHRSRQSNPEEEQRTRLAISVDNGA